MRLSSRSASALLLLLFFLAAPASARAAGPGSNPAGDPCQGPETNVDLEDTMPPIYDQGQSPWCSGFTAKTLLDYNSHQSCEKSHPNTNAPSAAGAGPDPCAYTPSTMLSATELMSETSGGDADSRGLYVDVSSDGSDISEVLEGAQKSGSLSDSQLPLDQALFVGSGASGALINRLTDYYSQIPSDLANTSGCAETQDPFADLEARYPLLQQIAAKAISNQGGKNTQAEDEFMQGIARAYYPIPSSLKPQPVKPPFNIDDFFSSNSSAMKNHIVNTLKQSQPLGISVCFDKIMQAEHIAYPNDPSDPCGAHGMVIVGFRKTAAGACEVHLRNSWGDQWPPAPNPGASDASAKNGDGTLWVDMNTVIQSEVQSPGQKGQAFDAVSITPRKPGSPIENQVTTDLLQITGETWHDSPVGPAKEVFKSGGSTITEAGTFSSSSMLTKGTMFNPKEGQLFGQFTGNPPKPVCGAEETLTHVVYCIRGGKPVGSPVSSPDRCPCVK